MNALAHDSLADIARHLLPGGTTKRRALSLFLPEEIINQNYPNSQENTAPGVGA